MKIIRLQGKNHHVGVQLDFIIHKYGGNTTLGEYNRLTMPDQVNNTEPIAEVVSWKN